MGYKCDECDSTFREKKNLQQRMRKDHGLKKYKCDHCNYHSDDRSNVLKHQKSKHGDEVFKCNDCEYIGNDKSNLNKHIRSKHIEKNLKCEQCDFVTDRKEALKIHIQAKHTLKKCDECEYSTYSLKDLKNHKDNQHEPDDFSEKSAFDKLIYQKTWRVRGSKDPLQTLQAYQAKIRNSMNDYIKEKGAVKWHIGIIVNLYKLDKDSNMISKAAPGFSSNTNISITMGNFEDLYTECKNKIMNDFAEFNANGSGWILDRVVLTSIHMCNYQPF